LALQRRRPASCSVYVYLTLHHKSSQIHASSTGDSLISSEECCTGWTLSTGFGSVCGHVFRCLHNMVPGYLSTLSQPVSSVPGHQHLLPADRGHLNFPRVRQATYGGRAFAYNGPSNWNSLPGHLRDNNLSLSTFKRQDLSLLQRVRDLSFFYGAARAPFACQRRSLPHRLAQCATQGMGPV